MNAVRAVASTGNVPARLSEADTLRAARLLVRRDPVLALTIKRIGACGLASRQQAHHLTALVRAIVGQQLSAKAAATIFARLLALFPAGIVTVDRVATLDDAALRGVGLSGQKVGYLRDLSAHLTDGRLVLEELDALGDEQVIERLVAVKGFGRWTAEMFLMFRLGRPDVLPVGDLGILKAVQKLYGLRTKPHPEKLRALAEPWRPFRSVACWYLWQSLALQTTPLSRAARPRPRRPSAGEGRSRPRSR